MLCCTTAVTYPSLVRGYLDLAMAMMVAVATVVVVVVVVVVVEMVVEMVVEVVMSREVFGVYLLTYSVAQSMPYVSTWNVSALTRIELERRMFGMDANADADVRGRGGGKYTPSTAQHSTEQNK